MRPTMRIIALSAVLALGAGCFGQFALTRKMYTFNQQLSSNKVVVTLAMWGMLIIPVYELVSLGDLIIFNVIEFWTGENPIAPVKLPQVEIEVDTTGAVHIQRGERQFVLVPAAAPVGAFTVREGGVTLGTAMPLADGGMEVRDHRGHVLHTYSDEDLMVFVEHGPVLFAGR